MKLSLPLPGMLVDLHVHLRGTMAPHTVRKLAKKNGVSLPEEILNAPGYGWTDFTSFLDTYDLVASVVQSADDIEEVAHDYLTTVAAEGTGYVEFMLSPPHDGRSGIKYPDQIAAIDAAADRALEETGIECRVISTAVRHLGPAASIEAARAAVSTRSHRLVGFGLTGDERKFAISTFDKAFAIARSEGLKTTAHAGEHLPAESIIEAIDVLRLNRVGHGVSATSSPTITRQLAAEEMPLEVCLGSNLSLGLYSGIENHPVSHMANAGCSITLGTDDPAFFTTSPALEYKRAAESAPDLLSTYHISKTAIGAAFCDYDTKAKLLSRLKA